MPPIICPRCQRCNPSQSVYCYFDGNLLRPDAVKGLTTAGLLTEDYIFPSKRRCKTLDDFVQGCQYEWEDARDLLKKGDFASYFLRIGRQDLARAAQDAARAPDADIAMHTFLSTLPANKSQAPKLDINPRRLLLNKVRPGEVKQIIVKVINQGKGFLQGKVSVSEGNEWLRVAIGGVGGQTPIKTANEQEVLFCVDTRGLAAPRSYNARLTIITNGGIAELPIRLDLGVTPFPHAPFKGATSPRDMAEKMRASAKSAVPLLENGEIQKWFAINGWSFPVSGVQAQGVAAVQQFFEGMGLSKPPPLQLTESEIQCVCVPPEVLQRQVWLQTSAKKWVYAQVDTSAHWLRVLTPNVSGAQQAAIGFEVDSSLMDEGVTHEGFITITGNAAQQLKIRVVVDVHKSPQPFTKRLFGGFFKMALIAFLYRLLFFAPGDLYARVLATGVTEPPTGTMARWAQPAANEEGYLRLFILATWWFGALVGLLMVRKKGGNWSDLLTGIIAGAMLGAISALTVACMVTLLDGIPRLVASKLANAGIPAGVATTLWLVLVLSWWVALGATAGGLLPMMGKRGRQAQVLFALPLTWVGECLGFRRPSLATGSA